MTLEITPGTVWVYGDRIVQIDGVDSLVHASVRDMASGKLMRVEMAKLRALPSASKQREIGYISESEWKRASELARALLVLPTEGRVAHQDLEPIACKYNVSIRQLQRLRKKLRKDARASVLVRSPGGQPKGNNRLSGKVNSVITHVIQKYYFRRERPGKSEIVERTRSMCRRLGLQPPSKNAVLRRIETHEGYEADIKRMGRKAAEQLWKPRTGRLNALAPLALIQIDHTLVDVMVVSDDRQSVLGRPWVTLAIDVCSRVVLGMYLSMDAPSSVSVSLCIEHAVLPKPEDAADPGLWPVYGKPACILVDNGKDLRAAALQRGCEEHGIELQWRPVRTPHYGAHIERLNGTLMRLCHLLPGTTFSNPRERGDYNSAARATLTLSELKDWLVEKIGRFYHARRHKALGMPPIVAWQRAHTDESGQIHPPRLVADPASFRIDFLPYEFRQVNRTGVELHGSRYWHADLAPLIRSPEKTMVRYDPRSPQFVWVRLPSGQLVEAPAIAGPAVGDPSGRIQLDAATLAQMDSAIDKHYERCDRIEAEAALETRRARRGTGKSVRSSSSGKSRVSSARLMKPDAYLRHLSEAEPTLDSRTQAICDAVQAEEALVAPAEGMAPATPAQEQQGDTSRTPVDPAPTVFAPPPAEPPALRHPAVSPLTVEDWI